MKQEIDRQMCPTCGKLGELEYHSHHLASGPSGTMIGQDGAPHKHLPVWYERIYKCPDGHKWKLCDYRPCYLPCAWVPEGFPGHDQVPLGG